MSGDGRGRAPGRCPAALALPALLLADMAGAQSNPAAISWSQVLGQPPGWYASAEAVRIADNVLLYQHANGGWEKNIDMARPTGAAARTRIREQRDSDGTTIDNGATYTQIRFLARVHEATGRERFRRGMLRGIDFVLAAQYANGGWPQFYPRRRGYYEHVTFNDGAMVGVMRLVRDVAKGSDPFASVDSARRTRAASAMARGLDLILRTQVEVDGKRTVWCTQYDRGD